MKEIKNGFGDTNGLVLNDQQKAILLTKDNKRITLDLYVITTLPRSRDSTTNY